MKTIKLYYHKTDGGAEYLTDRWTLNTNGTKEGVFHNARYIVRLDNRTLTIPHPNLRNSSAIKNKRHLPATDC